MKEHYLFPDNYSWSLSAAQALNCGGAFGEVFSLCQTLQKASGQGDLDAWYEGWLGLAERVITMAKEEEAQGLYVSAGETYKRAAAYYHSGERMLQARTKRRIDMFVRSQEAFAKYAKYRKPPMEFVTFPYENTELSGYFIQAQGVKFPAPCVAYFGGLDTSVETIAARAEGLDKRGISCLAVDGPGWGASLKLRGITARYDYEVVARYVVDYLETRPDVDARRLGVTALSLGGYYAPRIAAFEKRFKAGAAWGAQWDYPRIVQGRLKKIWDASIAVPSDRSQAPWVFGVETLEEVPEAAKNFKLDGVAQKITCPFLVVHGENDQQVPLSDAQTLYNAIGSADKKLKVFTIADRRGGIEHCQWDNQDLVLHVLYDWFAAKL